ncbi:hypothetical protein Btru_042075 [Bulinus truncatus]|nr:hypothetical protein Btru_042075 [Bulinus truncatus]
MEYLTQVKLCLAVLYTFICPSYHQTIQTDNRLARKSNDFITGQSSTSSNKGNCYDRCYDAYLSNRNDVTGCVCGQFDFHGRSKTHNCNCPLDTICEENFGGRTCVPRGDIGGAIIGGGKYGSGPIPDYSKIIGSLHGSKDLCGQLSNHCRAKSPGFNIVYKYTYDPIKQLCSKVLVYATCISGNLFDTQTECMRVCDTGKVY